MDARAGAPIRLALLGDGRRLVPLRSCWRYVRQSIAKVIEPMGRAWETLPPKTAIRVGE